jgi:hypothetical protein
MSQDKSTLDGSSSEPIPNDLRDAFWGAIGAYSNWSYGQPEPEISYQRRPISISLVCDLVGHYDDPMPTDFWNLLTSLAPRSEDPPAGQSFASGARFLQKQIGDKQRRFNLMDRSK